MSGGRVLYMPRFISYQDSCQFSDYSNENIPWIRSNIRVFAKSHVQVLKAIPGSSFNSLLLNRYIGGNDYVGWHSDDEKLYGPTPQIASISFGCMSQLEEMKVDLPARD